MKTRVHAALRKVTDLLLAEANPAGHWSGELSSSALSTAVATIALDRMSEKNFKRPGLRWLAENQNADGGWGDTIRSQSNLSTTALVWGAFSCANEWEATVARAQSWLWKQVGSIDRLPDAIIARYGKDRTFSVPILMTLALSGRLGEAGWRNVIPLPFELAALPQSWFGALQLPVVSYALPALIAIGQTIHHHAPSKNPIARLVRNCVKKPTLVCLDKLQPPNGGFLEATPLTAFVTMSLASMGLQNHPVAQRGASFLKNSIRGDGSWPIDTNLATWLTTLAVKALSHQRNALPAKQAGAIRTWLLDQQYKAKHPYTGAASGGWAWTDLAGGVPDADDTAGALVALSCLGEGPLDAIGNGLNWLLKIQNRDGGIPTFCKGWGTLPFDRSSPELTVHAMQAWSRWQAAVDRALAAKIEHAMARAEKFLAASQRCDGAWIPLWFGNENAPEQENAVYGTARTLIGLNEMSAGEKEMRELAARFLEQSNLPESIEETALAVEAIADARGIDRLLELVESNQFTPAPIGLYFARLWYFEKLYPLIFATSALGRIASQKF